MRTLKIQMGSGVWIFGHSRKLLLNKFFDPSTPSVRKVNTREEKRKEKIMLFIVATNVVASRPLVCIVIVSSVAD